MAFKLVPAEFLVSGKMLGKYTLLGDHIQSSNYVPGVSGWAIFGNGNVEFNIGTFRGSIIGASLFLYNGTPAKGSLFLAIAPAAGTDQFGNHYGIGMNVGVWSASTGNMLQHFGIDNAGRLYLADTTGTTRIFSDPSAACQLIYDSAGQSLGHLMASLAAAAGTDAAGNNFDAGVAAYVVDSNTGDRWAVDLGTGVVIGNSTHPSPALVLRDLTNPFFTPPSLSGFGTGAGGGGLQMSSGQAVTGTNRAALFSVEDQSASTIPGGLIQGQAGQAQFNLGAAGSMALASLTAVLPDVNTYRTERLILDATATPQTISSTSATVITGCTALVKAGTYAFRARITFKGASASGTANFSVTGPAISAAWINGLFIIGGVPGAGAQNATLGPVDSPTLTTQDGVADIEGEATFSAAGTIALACAMSSGGANVVIDKARFWLYPV